jgi:hypothetical protein
MKAEQSGKPPPPKPVDPLRQYGVGPALLAVYVFGLVILQFILVSLGAKSPLGSC